MNKLLFIFTLFFTLLTSNAKAEYCWMIGCEGRVGYVFIPDTQLWDKDKEYITLEDGKEYKIDTITDRPVFKTNGLPKVGEIVELSITTALYSKEEIKKNINILKKYEKGIAEFSKGYFNQTYKHLVIYYESLSLYSDNYPMDKDTKLKILGYKTFKHGGFLGLFADKYLFAEVEVIEDGNKQY